MIALHNPTKTKITAGPRPINLGRDVGQIVQLLELVFQPQTERHRSPNIGQLPFPLNWWQAWHKDEQLVGFVWEQNGQIIGNVTLIHHHSKSRYFIANVATHPDYRRQGIAQRLMEETLHWTAAQPANTLYLQVEEQNRSAVRLYERLGFASIDTAHTWSAGYDKLRKLPVISNHNQPDHFGRFRLRPLGKQDWQVAYDLDQESFPPEMNWLDFLPVNTYQQSWSNWWQSLMTGSGQEAWLAVDITSHGQERPIGLGVIETEWGQPYRLKLRVRPAWRGEVERALFAKLLRRVRYLASRPVRMDHLTRDTYVSDLAQQAGFQLRRTLTTMRCDHGR